MYSIQTHTFLSEKRPITSLNIYKTIGFYVIFYSHILYDQSYSGPEANWSRIWLEFIHDKTFILRICFTYQMHNIWILSNFLQNKPADPDL